MQSFKRIALTAAISTVVLSHSSVQAESKTLGDLTGYWELLVDDHAVAAKTNLKRKYYAFKKHKDNPIMVPDKPWEKDVISVNTVLPTEDGTGYRMWYYCWTDKKDKHGSYDCYATSKDGITWEKPEVGIYEGPDGTKKNNIVPHSGASIMHTPWTNDPERQYMSVTGGQYFTAVSPDGLHWKRVTDKAIVGGGDVGFFRYDPHRKKFLGFVKVGSVVSGLTRRSVGFTESDDLMTCPELRRIMAPDDFDDRWVKPESVQRTHFYGCPFFMYENMYLGLLWIYRSNDEDEGYFHGPIFTELVTSRDGFHWQRQEGDRPAMLDVGKPPRSWDQGMIAGLSLVLVGDQLRLYYSGYDGPHDWLPFHSGIGLATLRKDGFASLDAGEAAGELLTKRLRNATGPLHVNYRAGAGSILVEVLDESGKVLPGFSREDCDPLKEDKVDAVVTWKGKEAWPENAGVVRLRFLMKNASLYSFMLGEKLEVVEEPAPTPLQALYTFEGDWGIDLQDKLYADGQQDLKVMGTIRRDRDASHAAKGKQSLLFGTPWHPLHRLKIEGTQNLGRRFTLAIYAQNTDKRPARLFSAYIGHRAVNTSELVFDCDPRGKPLPALRLICRGIPIESGPLQFDDGKYHHMAVTFDEGHVLFYVDGKNVGEGWLPGGESVKLCRDLMVGEDLQLGSDEQLRGNIDDILVYGDALTAEQVAALAEKGAEAFIDKSGALVMPAGK